ncbi:MAG: hypothetical protein ABR554_05515 [Pyrinomonadaceae bacterium]
MSLYFARARSREVASGLPRAAPATRRPAPPPPRRLSQAHLESD